ncbi:hypothetical protein H5410_003366 [Solanum commersonii]|uniref:Uncharacterized protein n=1 Tax=Solanum commersonii TaxID=4109 RepID=A0A9J6B4M5_SOLCO|nr:hypothetical protein H5410_003366 [Solanum commersonii]
MIAAEVAPPHLLDLDPLKKKAGIKGKCQWSPDRAAPSPTTFDVYSTGHTTSNSECEDDVESRTPIYE